LHSKAVTFQSSEEEGGQGAAGQPALQSLSNGRLPYVGHSILIGDLNIGCVRVGVDVRLLEGVPVTVYRGAVSVSVYAMACIMLCMYVCM